MNLTIMALIVKPFDLHINSFAVPVFVPVKLALAAHAQVVDVACSSQLPPLTALSSLAVRKFWSSDILAGGQISEMGLRKVF